MDRDVTKLQTYSGYTGGIRPTQSCVVYQTVFSEGERICGKGGYVIFCERNRCFGRLDAGRTSV